MTGMNNRETFLKTEPEMDITQFAKTELDLVYADESPNQILDVFYPEDGEGPYPYSMVELLRRDTRGHITLSQCVCL